MEGRARGWSRRWLGSGGRLSPSQSSCSSSRPVPPVSCCPDPGQIASQHAWVKLNDYSVPSPALRPRNETLEYWLLKPGLCSAVSKVLCHCCVLCLYPAATNAVSRLAGCLTCCPGCPCQMLPVRLPGRLTGTPRMASWRTDGHTASVLPLYQWSLVEVNQAILAWSF